MRLTALRGTGVAWLKCPVCRLKCSDIAVGPSDGIPLCGHVRMLELYFADRSMQESEDAGRS
ncbi:MULTISPECIES: hypothetical protein [Streptomyces]|uniref:Uncharacterized protein n=1 Tax=Streptomyces sp. 900129855 TaxID=3155129 RepID=A0ABV2ZGZ7_9ACTN